MEEADNTKKEDEYVLEEGKTADDARVDVSSDVIADPAVQAVKDFYTRMSPVSIHKDILGLAIEIIRKTNKPCVSIKRVRDELDTDFSIVLAHFRIMEVDGIGVFLTDSEENFCFKAGFKELFSTLFGVDDNKER